jgi:hypothetical protein
VREGTHIKKSTLPIDNTTTRMLLLITSQPIHQENPRTMNRTELKEIVLQVLTPEEVATFGDKRLTATWQKAYDSLTLQVTEEVYTSEPMSAVVTSVSSESIDETEDETVGCSFSDVWKSVTHVYKGLLLPTLLFIIHYLLVGYFLTQPQAVKYSKLAYHRVKSITTQVIDDLCYGLFCLILDY